MFQSGKHRRCNFNKTCQGSLKMFPNVIFQKWKTNVLEHFFHKGRWGGSVVSVLIFHYDIPSSKPADVFSYHNRLKRMKK